MRGAASLGGVLARVVLIDLGKLDTYRSVGSVIALAAAIGVVTICVPIGLRFAELGPLSLRLQVAASMLPSALVVTLPFAALTPPLGARKDASFCAVSVLLVALSIGNLGWFTPHANQWFRETTYASYVGRLPDAAHVTPQPGPERGIAEQSLTELIALSQQDGFRGRRAEEHLNSRAAMLLMVPVCLFAGVQVRRLSRVRMWQFAASLPAACGVVVVSWVLGRFSAIAVDVAFNERSGPFVDDAIRIYGIWLVPGICLLLTVLIAVIARRRERVIAAVAS